MICPICFNIHKRLLKTGVTRKIFKKYEIVGGGIRRNKCPSCGSTDRERLIYIYLVDFLKIFERKYRVLHIAPEQMIYFKLYGQIESYTVGDLSPQFYPNIVKMEKIDLLDSRFENESFDLIICNHVLEHILDEGKALEEILRLLSPKGKAILQVPIALKLVSTLERKEFVSPKDRLENYGQSDHVRLYGKDYKYRLMKYGFLVSVYNLFSEYARFGINPNEDLYVVSKPNKK